MAPTPKKKEEPKPVAAPKDEEPVRPKTPDFDPATVTVKQKKNGNIKQCGGGGLLTI